jgi:hypothetical protein
MISAILDFGPIFYQVCRPQAQIKRTAVGTYTKLAKQTQTSSNETWGLAVQASQKPLNI